MDEITAYPLAWPAGRPRTKTRKTAVFGRRVAVEGQPWKSLTRLTIDQARALVTHELKLLGAKETIISTNLRLRGDGFPYSAQAAPADPGVAVYFKTEDGRRCIAIDQWDRVADNFRAIAKSIEALRGLDRWGGGQIVAAAFSGFAALPAPGQTSNDVRTVEEAAEFVSNMFGGDEEYRAGVLASRPVYEDARRVVIRKLHPDRNGGEPTLDWHRLQSALTLLDKHHGRA